MHVPSTRRTAAGFPELDPVDRTRRALMLSATATAGAALVGLPGAALAASRQDVRGFGSWATAPVSAAPADANRVNNQTVRNVVRTSLGGESMRVKLSNRYGTAPLVVAGAQVSISNGNANALANTGGVLRFSGRTSFTIPAFGELYSDWISFPVPAMTDLAVDIYLSGDTSAGTSPLTLHNARPAGQLLSYLAAGSQMGVATFPAEASRAFWYFITGVDVSANRVPGTVVCFGDSITDGSQSTFYANARYPDFLARRIVYGNTIEPMGVVNLGIGGNRVLNGGTGDSGLARFDRDVLTQSGVSHIVVLLGINDITGGSTADRIIQGHRQLIQRAHARRLRIYGGTLTPYGAAPQPREDQRQAVNRWIRTSGEYDAVIDFDLATRDPANPRVMLARYDSGDTLHPNSVGYAAMAEAIDLRLFQGTKVFYG